MAVAAACPAARSGPWCCRQQRSSSGGSLAARPWRRQQQRPALVRAAGGDAGGGGSGELELPKPRKPAKLEPSYWLSREEAVEAQLKALKHNNFPTIDHGIETLYRFAGFDPWDRSSCEGQCSCRRAAAPSCCASCLHPLGEERRFLRPLPGSLLPLLP
jgi:hypothetical protein